MEALALDEEALKKLRVDGWNFHSSTHPTRTEAYPADVARGSATVAVAKSCPQLQVLRWWDRLSVYLLLTGSSTTVDTCARHSYSPVSTTATRRAKMIPAEHQLSEFSEWVQRSATIIYCEACSDGNKRVYLCDRVRPGHYPNNDQTCQQIWHLRWKNGEERPRPRVGRDIQMRGLGKKRRRRAEGTEASEVADREEDEAVSAAAGEEEVASDQDRNEDSV
ncbi:hypothetical protein PI126_g10084 [Phytophthora idaei]|nr:hypothetical protein PI126_g10084 [Phytophthora idaei]